MLLVLIGFGCLLFFVAVLFYKQRRPSVELLQLEWGTRAEKIPELGMERQPLILRGCPTPPILQLEKLRQVPRLHDLKLRTMQQPPTFGQYLKNPAGVLPAYQAVGVPILAREAGLLLADELVLGTWVGLNYADLRSDLTGLWEPASKTVASVLLGGRGLQRTVAHVTCILPTEGSYVASILSPASESFLPKVWENKYADAMTINDTPLVGELKYIDIVLRPGTMLCLPTHLIVSLKPRDVSACNIALCVEIHSPVSYVASLLENL